MITIPELARLRSVHLENGAALAGVKVIEPWRGRLSEASAWNHIFCGIFANVFW